MVVRGMAIAAVRQGSEERPVQTGSVASLSAGYMTDACSAIVRYLCVQELGGSHDRQFRHESRDAASS